MSKSNYHFTDQKIKKIQRSTMQSKQWQSMVKDVDQRMICWHKLCFDSLINGYSTNSNMTFGWLMQYKKQWENYITTMQFEA
jgi:hypothetical protein